MTASKKGASAATEAPRTDPASPVLRNVEPTRKVAAKAAPVKRPYSVHRPAKSPVDAIRLFCLECCGSSLDFGREDAAVRDCPCGEMCSLYPYRFGKNPRHSRASARTVEKAGLRPSNRSGTRPNAAGGP